MNLWKKFTELTITKKLKLGAGAVMDVNGTEVDLTELAALNNIAAADLAKIDGITNGTAAAGKAVVADSNIDVAGLRNVTVTGSFIIGSADMNETDLEKLDGITDGTPAASKALVADSAVGVGAFRETARNLRKQAAAAAKTTAVTLTAAEIMAGLITANQGGTAAADYTLPLVSDLNTALLAAHPGLANDDSFDFSLINISTTAGEDITVVTNTGWTLVGEMTVEANDSDRAQSSGMFRVRRTAADAYTIYRIA